MTSQVMLSMRKSTALWIIGILCVGMILVSTTQKVTDKRQELAQLTTDTLEEEEALRVLQAEWSYLNQPERLEKLNNQYLSLVPMTGKQFARLDNFENRAPVVTDPETPSILDPLQTTENLTPPKNTPSEQTAEQKTDETPNVDELKIVTPIAGHVFTPSLPPRKKPAITRIKKQQPKTVNKTTPTVVTPKTEKKRNINDVMRSLGVN